MIPNVVIGAVLGAVAGFAWQRLVGCSTGACPLMSNPWVSTAYGLVAGILIATSAR
ncbi:MAG: YtxH domain-containing protein [Verrucomicrobia bacterium]|nr:YtxH domain-containing protein [Verrucomicrobiota bacterium]